VGSLPTFFSGEGKRIIPGKEGKPKPKNRGRPPAPPPYRYSNTLLAFSRLTPRPKIFLPKFRPKISRDKCRFKIFPGKSRFKFSPPKSRSQISLAGFSPKFLVSPLMEKFSRRGFWNEQKNAVDRAGMEMALGVYPNRQ
jgi:hypothetical protein